MQGQFASIPPFWQGVLGSILAAIIVGVAVKLYQIQAAQSQRANKKNKKFIAALKTKLASADPLTRIEGYFLALFTLMSYLFLGNLCWILGSVVSPLLGWPVVVLLDLLSLVVFAGGLYWINMTMPKPS